MAESSASPAVGRALDVLTYLAERTGTVPAATLARDLGLPRSSLYHLLTALTERGFVLHVPEARGYALGAAAYRLASSFTGHEQLERTARPVLTRIAARHEIVVHLGILRGANTLYLAKEHPPRESDLEPTLVTEIGVLLPAHLTANGRAILAQLGPATVRALFARPADFTSRTGRGPRSAAELLAELEAERRRGWSEEVELVTPGLRSAGAPVFDLHGQAIAAVSCTWRSRVALREPGPLVDAVVAGAQEITRRLQGR
ncbi:IclR family transcriptional regulator [Nigerium massiliense]|uniref:IclR family transcriptional regulator n=1 Tax=Nigerium massiliense TaxID=1522317 RepID=UPI00058FF040|nr:IclR family transcriptional regulator [Nigerium massiliense]